MAETPHGPRGDEVVRQRVVGALASVVFFSSDPNKFIRRPRPFREAEWRDGRVVKTSRATRMEGGGLPMPCLPSPDALEDALDRYLPPKGAPFSHRESWSRHGRLVGRFKTRADDGGDYANSIAELIATVGYKLDKLRVADNSWKLFLRKPRQERRLLVYSQRYWLDISFPAYNPAAGDQLFEGDRPYDFDHIFPRRSISKNNKKWAIETKNVSWFDSIGNLRAWPMELDSADGHIPPAAKLGDSAAAKLKGRWRKVMPDSQSLRDASLVGDDWSFWKLCGGSESEILSALNGDSGLGRAFLMAPAIRLTAVYRNWYDSFDVASTFGRSGPG
jgi:hypothetical protein